MAKYKVGDQFIATITDVSESGMGTQYTFNNGMYTTGMVVDHMMQYQKPSNLTENVRKEEKPKEYTIEELHERIFVISDLLHKTVEAYRKAKDNVNSAVKAADKVIDGE